MPTTWRKADRVLPADGVTRDDIRWTKAPRDAPLFPSYVFFCGNEAERIAALATDRLCQIIPVRDQQKLTAELTALHRLIEGGMKLELYPFATIGRRCRITRGPFEGLEGTVVQRKENRTVQLVLEVSMLGQGASMEMEADLLEPA